MPKQPGPFTTLKVIDFTHVLAGPACAYYLALLGAEVIKVESEGRGDAMRHRGGTDPARAAQGMSTAYMTQGAGKRSVTLDLETAAGRAQMDELLASADIFVENHRPKTLKRLDLDWERLNTLNPRLIHCALTGYGRGGPLEDAPAYDVNIQAASGLMSLTGTPETGPLRTGAPIIDYSVALAAAFAISTALYHRENTGRGQFVDVSMLETAFTLMSSTITDHLLTGHDPKPRGNAANSRSPSAGSFPCRKGILSLGVNEERQFMALAKVLDRLDWLSDPRFSSPEKRLEHAGELSTDLTQALSTRTATEWEATMLANDVPAACVVSLPEALAKPQVIARRYLKSAGSGVTAYPGLPFRLSEAPDVEPDGPVEKLGQSTESCLPRVAKR